MIGLSLLLIAAGAVARFAMDAHYTWDQGVNLHVVGVILMIVGGIGVVVSLLLTAIASDPGPTIVRRRRTVVADPVDDEVVDPAVDDVPVRRRRWYR